jgi:hypothetical protein
VSVIAVVLSLFSFILHLENQVECLFINDYILLVFVCMSVCGLDGCDICILCSLCVWVLRDVGHVNAVKCGG